ncbi:tripartite tricarboxylate transporter TctB family protein [Humidisolicoccus flavus]|uniref:tripartite tricarboxylate transporter TctB family protein n=1 Tax=Humidisolicoccus flavus TaxID=3111414 RepID=UPI003248DA9A
MSTEQPVVVDEAIVEVEGDEAPAASRRLEIIVALSSLVFMSAMLALSFAIELRREPAPGQMDARFWPTMLAAVGVFVSVWRVIVAFVGTPDERDDLERIQPGGPRRLALTLLVTAGYVALWNVQSVVLFGYRIQLFLFITALFLAILMFIYGWKSWKDSWKGLVIYPILTSIGIYYLFGTLLRIPL